MPPIIGRIEEQHRLDTLYQSQKAEFLAVYGRRRVGKTFLISQFFKNKGIYLEITGSKEASTREQLTYFYREFSALFQSEEASIAPQNWSEAFHLLTKAFEKIPPSQKLVLFFDELPWLASPKSKFLSVLDYYWNRHFSKMSNILLIICGSAASWMIKKVIHHRGGLYGRLSYEIRLQPFSLSETRDFFRAKQIELSEKQIVEVYMVTGGIPKYLSYVEKGLSSMQVINALCFTPQGPLVKEFHKLYSSLFEDAYRHTTIIALLAKKRNGLLQKEIQQQAQIPLGGRFGEILEELEESGFIIPLSTY